MEPILLIEHHRLMRAAIRDLLASHNAACREAADSIEGIHQVRERQPEIIILDTTWPEVNGLWLSQVLRELAPKSKIILLVDESMPDHENTARINGDNASIIKQDLVNQLPIILALWQNGSAPITQGEQ